MQIGTIERKEKFKHFSLEIVDYSISVQMRFYINKIVHAYTYMYICLCVYTHIFFERESRYLN